MAPPHLVQRAYQTHQVPGRCGEGEGAFGEGANPNAGDKDGRTPAYVAREGGFERLAMLIEG
jgi:hypothetical protein